MYRIKVNVFINVLTKCINKFASITLHICYKYLQNKAEANIRHPGTF